MKFVYGLFAFAAAVFAVWASGFFSSFLPPRFIDTLHPSTVDEIAIASPPAPEESGKLTVRFQGFELGKDWMANFEIINYTSRPVIYVGFKTKSRFDFCTLEALREVIPENGINIQHSGNITKSQCIFSQAVILQTLDPNETVVFSVFKNEVQNLVNIREIKSAHIGFEFFVGDEKRRMVLWSEEITFPEDGQRPGDINRK